MWDLETIIAMNRPKSETVTPSVYPEVTARPDPGIARETATYRIFTEDVNRSKVLELAGKRFKGFTVTIGTGYFEGQPEDALILEIVTSDTPGVALLAEEIRKANKQESVLVSRIESSTLNVCREGLVPVV
jgi:hypothetical protein